MDTVILEGGCWPTKAQELVLRAALLQNQDAIEAWSEWKAHVDFDMMDWGSYRLMPMVYQNLKKLDVRDPLMGRLGGIHRHTWYKNHLLMRELPAVLRAYQDLGIRTMLLKGGALVLLYYKDYGLRPMLDLDPMVPLQDANRAIKWMTERGWEPKFKAPHAWGFNTPNGYEFDLHWHVLAECCEANADDDFWAGAVPLQVEGYSTLALNPTDQLFHVCVHGVGWNVLPPVRWVADAITILRASPIDWTRLIVQARRRNLLLGLRTAFDYLQRTLDAPIPSDVLNRMQAIPISRTERLDYAAKTLPPSERDPFLTFWAYSREYLRSVANENLLHKFIAFPGFLQSLWGMKHLWQVPIYGVMGAARRTQKFLKRKSSRIVAPTLDRQ